ncbi:YhgE/Pip domain-containing protein [Microbacterium trichothecenolyticum]|uniref:Membrane protein n=1 Tax=Microbacterium trichothecenolyticum TaxID=69370 RepID=A0ABU0TW53_MICTR|nr:YhgE/Pip domain-containing protein [Microbacterium trichothecenolyticum]MDQ1123890.1 putative membrane protein [Microbacterium trichothecenolyticum]
MKIPQMIAAELRRLTSTRMAVLALVALLAVPILYGGLYLWANQDPYGNLSSVPVALVVEDQGAEVNGQQRNLGDEAAEQLLDSDTFEWHRVSSDQADAGLAVGDFDFVVTLPTDFSDAVASLSSDSPRQADIELRTNDANNYLASTIGTQAVARIQASVAKKVVDEAGRSLLDALHTIRVSLVDATTGATQIVDGLATAKGGSSQLSSGSVTLADGSSQLADGTAQLATGASQLRDGTARLRDGSAQLADGAQQVAGGVDRIDSAAREVGSIAADANARLPEARADILKALQDAHVSPERIDEILARLDTVGEKLSAANTRVQDTVTQINRLDDGARQVAAGSSSLASGAATAADGASALADGAGTAASAAAQVRDGSAQLRDGASQLDSGIAQLATGATQLRDGLSSGVQQIPDSDDATRQAQASAISDPVAVGTSAVTKAQNYGAGLAPFFAALAGWIGIYALFLIVKPVSKRAITALRSPVRVTLAGWLTPAGLGALQMVGLFTVLAIALQFSFANPWAALGILVFASATYAAIVLALNVWLGSVGQFLGLVLMVLQLVTAGGTFPWQTLPAPLAALHHVLPMGYVVDAMRQVMYGGDVSRVGPDLLVLAGWLLGGVVLAALGVTRMTHHRTLRDLQPSLIG